ncbi:bifunctional phosphopantothenoylcysteine decarboxylase/phosphopantothenate--cysteine ligase CoaBC [Pelagibacterium halotolerans]|uniref:bifunctional phosphopantothenoylcysteine decarboxylase/phosphopantothenate--cysteine ligase CoaBC n=1 Tax=Pelagibacterium halotolerans TaxID=531813 RepID=UPI00384E47A9
MLHGKHILLVISGGIAAYKAQTLIRLIQKAGGTVQAILTKSAAEFVSPLTVAALSGKPALTELFDLTQETEIGHIELSRSADLIVAAPATANLLAKLAHGLADDLASTCLLATDTPIMTAPAMNVRMWEAAATRRNMATLRENGVIVVGPDEGEMACGEYGPGRMAEPEAILAAIETHFEGAPKPLAGRYVIVTSGPTREPIDPVRYISNASSGKQGTAIAEALAALGAKVSFITGPAEYANPQGCDIVRVTAAREMDAAVEKALPADVAVFCAAVADWHVANPAQTKIKKEAFEDPPPLNFAPNPDILKRISTLESGRPDLVIGFAAETGDLEARAARKFAAKGCDWLLANDVSTHHGVFGGNGTDIVFFDSNGHERWGAMTKTAVAQKLAQKVAAHFR